MSIDRFIVLCACVVLFSVSSPATNDRIILDAWSGVGGTGWDDQDGGWEFGAGMRMQFHRAFYLRPVLLHLRQDWLGDDVPLPDGQVTAFGVDMIFAGDPKIDLGDGFTAYFLVGAHYVAYTRPYELTDHRIALALGGAIEYPVSSKISIQLGTRFLSGRPGRNMLDITLGVGWLLQQPHTVPAREK